MATIIDVCVVCFRSFEALLALLEDEAAEFTEYMPIRTVENQYGRFRIWCGNLGVLQKGNASLDVRLRDSTVLRENVMKLLTQLDDNLTESIAITSRARLPYEKQNDLGEHDDDSSSTDEDDDDEDAPPVSELQMRCFAVQNIMDHFYKLSFRIRNPALRPNSSQAMLHRDLVDVEHAYSTESSPGTFTRDIGTREKISTWLACLELGDAKSVGQAFSGPSSKSVLASPPAEKFVVDTFDVYAKFDQAFMTDLFNSFSSGLGSSTPTAENTALREVLTQAITARRRQMRYWSKHANKLAAGITDASWRNNEQEWNPKTKPHQTVDPRRHGEAATMANSAGGPQVPRTVYTDTNFSYHPPTEVDAVDAQSVQSYASTALGTNGSGVDFPPPPAAARNGEDFVCPYCSILCPARQGRGRSWKNHVLRDLRPYVCTYDGCTEADRMYGSRTQWLQHEAKSHRKVWRCHQHEDAVYRSFTQLVDHLKATDKLSDRDIDALIEITETSLIDERSACPICYASSDSFPHGMQNHIANHLERIALFALPRALGDDLEDSTPGSNTAHARIDDSQDMSSTGTLTFPEDDRSSNVKRPSDTSDPTSTQSCIAQMEMCIGSLGEEHPTTLGAMRTLVEKYSRQGDSQEAEEVRVRAVEIGKRMLLKEDTNTLYSIRGLAFLCHDMRKLEDAEYLATGVMEIQRKLRGEEDTDTLNSLHFLATIYRDEGRLMEAEELGLEVADMLQRLVGNAHPYTLDSKHGLALTYYDHGRLEDAERLMTEVMNGREKCFGEKHLETLDSMHILASIYREQGKHGAAEALGLRVLELRKGVSGEDDLLTLGSMTDLAETYCEQGRWKDAEDLKLIVVAKTARLLGELHPTTLSSVSSLAWIYSRQGIEKASLAEKTHQRALQGYEITLGIENLSTLRSANDLGRVYKDHGKLADAETMYRRALEGYDKALGAHHVSTLSVVKDLADVYAGQNKLEEAEAMYQRALESQEQTHQRDYPETLEAVSNLGLLFEKQGKFDEAKRLYQRALEPRAKYVSSGSKDVGLP